MNGAEVKCCRRVCTLTLGPGTITSFSACLQAKRSREGCAGHEIQPRNPERMRRTSWQRLSSGYQRGSLRGAQDEFWRLVQAEPVFLNDLHHAHNLFRISGLYEVRIGPQVISCVYSAACAIYCENDDRDAPDIRLRSFPLQQLKASHLRQIKIQQNQRGQRILAAIAVLP